MPGGRRRVLYVGTLPPHPGGSAIWGRGLLPKLAGLGHPIIAMAPIPDGAIVDDAGPGAAGIEVRRYRVPYFDIDPFSSSDRSFYDTQRQRIIDQVAPVLASGWPEVILIGNAGLISGIPELGRRQGIPTIAVVHTAHWFDGSAPTGAHLSRPRMLELLGACDRVVGVAHHVAAALARLDLAHLSAIPNAVDLEVFRPGSRPDALAARHRIPCDAPVVSHLSNLKPIKEAWRLLRAAPMILDRHPRAVFLVMGDGPGREELARLRQELGPSSSWKRWPRAVAWFRRRSRPRASCSAACPAR
jgi:glycosyltransferase involved in cell wall biosynthesis